MIPIPIIIEIANGLVQLALRMIDLLDRDAVTDEDLDQIREARRKAEALVGRLSRIPNPEED